MNTGDLRLVIFLAAVLSASTSSVCQSAADKDLSRFLTPAGKVQSSLTLRDSQGGFAGFSGELWTLTPDGHFTIAHFLNDKTEAPYWQSDLSQAELKSVAQALSANRFLQLPASLGGEPKVNPHSLTLSFGNKQSTLALPPGEATGTTTDADSHSFMNIVEALHQLAKGHQK